jgi:hypothetical protein
LIDRLIPEKTGAVYIIQGVDLNSKDRHAHCTGLYKRYTPEGSLYCVELLDNEEKLGNKLTQYYSVLSGLGLGLGGCEILLSEEDLDKFDEPVKDRNSISCIKSTFNDSIKFDYCGIIGRWLKPDFGFDGVNSDDASDFKPNGDPVITVMKTLDGRDFTGISPFQFLEAVRDGAGIRLAEPYEKYIAREMAQQLLLVR